MRMKRGWLAMAAIVVTFITIGAAHAQNCTSTINVWMYDQLTRRLHGAR